MRAGSPQHFFVHHKPRNQNEQPTKATPLAANSPKRKIRNLTNGLSSNRQHPAIIIPIPIITAIHPQRIITAPPTPAINNPASHNAQPFLDGTKVELSSTLVSFSNQCKFIAGPIVTHAAKNEAVPIALLATISKTATSAMKVLLLFPLAARLFASQMEQASCATIARRMIAIVPDRSFAFFPIRKIESAGITEAAKIHAIQGLDMDGI